MANLNNLLGTEGGSHPYESMPDAILNARASPAVSVAPSLDVNGMVTLEQNRSLSPPSMMMPQARGDPPPRQISVPTSTHPDDEDIPEEYSRMPEDQQEGNEKVKAYAVGGKPNSSSNKIEFDVSNACNGTSPYVTFSSMKDLTDQAADTIHQNRKLLVEACYVGLAAIAGAVVRMVLAQWFGEECANPGTVGWLSASAPLCVTGDGDAVQQGGIIFSDLPSNMLGSFLMGIFQNGDTLHLALPMAVAWLSPEHPFQRMAALHIAFKTGFCGSLTTFSSWNSEMIVIMFGTGSANRSTRIWSAIFGYIVGMETALGSFVCGKSVARRLHRYFLPALAAEGDAVWAKRREGVYIHTIALPQLERRFLHGIEMPEQHEELLPVGQIESLACWRSTTETVRRVGHPLLPHLIAIEEAAFVTRTPFPRESESVARAEGWDVDSLCEWLLQKSSQPSIGFLPSLSMMSVFTATSTGDVDDRPLWFTLKFAGGLLGGMFFLLLLCLFTLNGPKATTITYRTMAYAMIFAPFGAVLRYKMATWNSGWIKVEEWNWLPFGTFAANMIGSIVSIMAIALEYEISGSSNVGNFWLVGTIRAVKIGFAGSLTTVSTFVAEVDSFMHNHTDHAYPYILITLVTACFLGAITYGAVLFIGPV